MVNVKPAAMDKAEITVSLNGIVSGLGGHMAQAASYLISRPEDVAVHSMRELARLANVPPVTLVRLAQRIGLEGYSDLRQIYIDAVLERSQVGSHAATRNIESARAIVASTRGEEGVANFVDAFFNGEYEILRRARADISEEKLSRVIELLASSRRIFVIGRRTSFPPALTLSYALRKARSHVYLLDDAAGAPEAALEDVEQADLLVAFTFAPFSRTTDTLTRRAASQGARIVVISDSITAPIHELAEGLSFIAPTLSRAFLESAGGAIALANLLAALTVAKLGKKAQHRVQENEKFLISSGEYVDLGKRSQRRRSRD